MSIGIEIHVRDGGVKHVDCNINKSIRFSLSVNYTDYPYLNLQKIVNDVPEASLDVSVSIKVTGKTYDVDVTKPSELPFYYKVLNFDVLAGTWNLERLEKVKTPEGRCEYAEVTEVYLKAHEQFKEK